MRCLAATADVVCMYVRTAQGSSIVKNPWSDVQLQPTQVTKLAAKRTARSSRRRESKDGLTGSGDK